MDYLPITYLNIEGVPVNNDDGYLLFTAVVNSGSGPVSDPVDVTFTWCSDEGETARLKDTDVAKAQTDVTTRKLVRQGLDVAASNPDERYLRSCDQETQKLDSSRSPGRENNYDQAS